MDSNLWTDKYKPTQLSEIIGNTKQFQQILYWLKNFNKTIDSKSIIISGPHGIGKTSGIKLLLDDLHFTYRIITAIQPKTSEAITELKNSMLIKSDINFMIHNNEKINRALVFDDTDTISSSSEKKVLYDLFIENEQHGYFPIIFITNTKYSKLIIDIKKNKCTDIKLYDIPNDKLENLILNVCSKENLLIKSQIVINKIIDFSNHDIRCLLTILQDLKYSFGNNEITIDNFEHYCDFSKKKNIDTELYTATRDILNTYNGIETCLNTFECDKVLIPLMIQENFHRRLHSMKNLNDFKKLELMQQISSSISKGDMIETSIYTDQNWYLQSILGFTTCVKTSYLINKNNNNDTPPAYYTLQCSSDLNKTSLKNINKKTINKLQETFVNKDINDFIFMNKLISHMIKNKMYKELEQMMNDYSLNIKHIETIIKIDKSDATNLTAEDRKIIANLLKHK